MPPVTLVVPVYNEEQIIEKKILNSLSLEYPKKSIKFLFINDGSTDATVSIIQRYSSVELINKQQRAGKTSALNDAMKQVTTPVVIFSDANNLINPI
ncbi:MAG TPA: glycosyltransferase, partial [Flavisolibacter sp.]|nr:glycosyltransferase [Flavisolibacter sp.]